MEYNKGKLLGGNFMTHKMRQELIDDFDHLIIKDGYDAVALDFAAAALEKEAAYIKANFPGEFKSADNLLVAASQCRMLAAQLEMLMFSNKNEILS